MEEKSNYDVGLGGEEKALAYLVENGFTPLAKNFRTRYGEIDLVVEKKNVVVFVEVKFRLHRQFGFPEEAVGFLKQKHLIKAALIFLSSFKMSDRQIRFDVVSVEPDSIKHFENAFECGPDFYY